jgi:hypothetical protein
MSIVQHYTIWHENESTNIVRVSPIENEQIVANIRKYDFFYTFNYKKWKNW